MSKEIEARLARYCKILSRSKNHTGALETVLHNQEENAKDDASFPEVQKWFLHVFAPVTVEYVLWVLYKAQEDGHKRLYFLARDGYLFYQIAKQIVKEAQLDIDCRYLKLSRYSLRTAEYALMDKEELLSYICARGIDVTFNKIMRRCGLTDDEAKEIAAFCGYQNRYDQVLTYGEIDSIKEQLKENHTFFSYVNEHSKASYPHVMGYFTQEGLLDGISFAIVDSGWLGTIQKSLKRLLQTVNSSISVSGYYFGLYETPPDTIKTEYNAYYFGQRGGLNRKARFSNCLFELVYSAPESMTLGYEKCEDEYRPILSKSINPNADILREHARLLECYMDAYICTCKKIRKDWWNAITADMLQRNVSIVEELLIQLMSAPIKKEVELYGNGLFCDDILESQMQPIAIDLTYSEIVNLRFMQKILFMLGIRKGVIRDSTWIEGSIVKCGHKVGRSLRAAIRYKYFVYFRKAIKSE